MARTMGIGELLRAVSQQKTKPGKINLLQANKSPQLASFLRHTFDPGIRFLLPLGDIDYTPTASGDGIDSHSFFVHLRRLYIFCAGGNDLITPQQRLAIFINMLQSIDQLDAEACMAMKDKKLPYNIPRQLIEEAFPGFLPVEKSGAIAAIAAVVKPKSKSKAKAVIDLNAPAPTSSSTVHE